MLHNLFLFVLIALILPVAQANFSNRELLCLVNKERTNRGIPPLGLDPLLTKAAQLHSDDMARMNKQSHVGSDGSEVWDRVLRVGFHDLGCGENLVYWRSTLKECMDAWMNSPGHRQNILDKSYEMFGSAVAYGSKANIPYYTQVFARDGKGSRNVPTCSGSDGRTPPQKPSNGGNSPQNPSNGGNLPQQPSSGGHQRPSFGGNQQPSNGIQKPSNGRNSPQNPPNRGNLPQQPSNGGHQRPSIGRNQQPSNGNWQYQRPSNGHWQQQYPSSGNRQYQYPNSGNWQQSPERGFWQHQAGSTGNRYPGLFH